MKRHYFQVETVTDEDGIRPVLDVPVSEFPVRLEVENGTYPPAPSEEVVVFVCLDEFGTPENESELLDALKEEYAYLGTIEYEDVDYDGEV